MFDVVAVMVDDAMGPLHSDPALNDWLGAATRRLARHQ
jgi:hypothetical protein